MELNFTHHYKGTPDQVIELLKNKEFLADVAKQGGATSHEATIEGDTTNLKMQMPTPSSVSKFIGNTVGVVMQLTFGEADAGGARKGNAKVSVQGAPVNADADAELRPEGENQSVADFKGDFSVKIPLVGKKVETTVAPMIERAFAGLERRANEWLTR